ncbi:MAG TPA: ABC transporter permease [Miltoncostaeaceae bacterium]|jgi:ABC-2 type transport system permease protein|nr:ABC transporter permease [Miltoncostaeaceae bacterium]
MSARTTWAVAERVLRQLRRDPRTVGLLVVVPCVLMVILRYAFDGQPGTFDRIAAPMLGLIPFITLFVVTSIAMLRERTSGTLERLMSMPVGKLDLLAGYGAAFALVALAQTAILAAVTLGPLGLDTARSPALLVVLALANALLGVTLGLFVSAFARSEFEAVQFMPAMVLPQLLLCGLFVARDQMAGWLEAISAVLPLTYAYDALARATDPGELGAWFAVDVAVVVGVTLLALVLGAATLRRRTP